MGRGSGWHSMGWVRLVTHVSKSSACSQPILYSWHPILCATHWLALSSCSAWQEIPRTRSKWWRGHMSYQWFLGPSLQFLIHHTGFCWCSLSLIGIDSQKVEAYSHFCCLLQNESVWNSTESKLNQAPSSALISLSCLLMKSLQCCLSCSSALSLGFMHMQYNQGASGKCFLAGRSQCHSQGSRKG